MTSGFRFPVLDDAHFFVLYYRRSSRRRNKKFKKNVRFVQCLVCNFESVYRRDILPPRRQSFFIPRVSAFGFFDISSHTLSHTLSLHLLIFISCSRFVTLIIIIMIIIIQNFVSWVFCLFFIVPPIVLSIKRCATHFVVFRIFFFFFNYLSGFHYSRNKRIYSLESCLSLSINCSLFFLLSASSETIIPWNQLQSPMWDNQQLIDTFLM